MKNSLETKLGIFVFLAILAAWAIVETLGSADWFHHGYHVSAQFNTAQDLKPGDRVKMAGVEIGRVEDIQLTESKVEVIMKLHDRRAGQNRQQGQHQIHRPDGTEFCGDRFWFARRAAKAKEGTRD